MIGKFLVHPDDEVIEGLVKRIPKTESTWSKILAFVGDTPFDVFKKASALLVYPFGVIHFGSYKDSVVTAHGVFWSKEVMWAKETILADWVEFSELTGFTQLNIMIPATEKALCRLLESWNFKTLYIESNIFDLDYAKVDGIVYTIQAGGQHGSR